MATFFKLKTWLRIFGIIVVGILLSSVIVYFEGSQVVPKVQALGAHNVDGYAWNENIGWVSFNCSNDNSCGTVDYGVNVDAGTGNFSGYAWSENVGWIDVAPVGPYPGSPSNSANYNSATGAVTGWAKVLSLGEDGWLKMSGTWSNGVSIDSGGDFHGWAWNGNSNDAGIGWLSFNCLDTAICATSNYAVHGDINSLPKAINLTAPNWNFNQACSTGARRAFLRWAFNDTDENSYQTAYQIIVDDDSNMADPILDTGKVNSGAAQYALDANYLNYNTHYYWWVKVWDDRDAASAWVQYNSATDTDNNDGNNLTFTTYKHEFPDVDFDWSPESPSMGEAVIFTDLSAADGGAEIVAWLWTVPADASIDDEATSTPTIVFGSSGDQGVTLQATDSDGYTCKYSENVDVSVSLPSWRETKAD